MMQPLRILFVLFVQFWLISGAAASSTWDCNLLNGKWKMSSRVAPGAYLIFSSEVSNGRYTNTRLEVKGIDGSNAVMTGNCSDFTRQNQISRDAMTITVGDGTWKFTRLSSLNPPPNQSDIPSTNSASQERSPSKENGRLRGGEMPLFTVGTEKEADEVRQFNHAWRQKEEELYELGEIMPSWNHSMLKTAKGKAAYLRVCDERIAAARSRKKR